MRTAKYGKRGNLEQKECKPQGNITDKIVHAKQDALQVHRAVFFTVKEIFVGKTK